MDEAQVMVMALEARWWALGRHLMANDDRSLYEALQAERSRLGPLPMAERVAGLEAWLAARGWLDAAERHIEYLDRHRLR